MQKIDHLIAKIYGGQKYTSQINKFERSIYFTFVLHFNPLSFKPSPKKKKKKNIQLGSNLSSIVLK